MPEKRIERFRYTLFSFVEKKSPVRQNVIEHLSRGLNARKITFCPDRKNGRDIYLSLKGQRHLKNPTVALETFCFPLFRNNGIRHKPFY
jgi:hypothetical protein